MVWIRRRCWEPGIFFRTLLASRRPPAGEGNGEDLFGALYRRQKLQVAADQELGLPEPAGAWTMKEAPESSARSRSAASAIGAVDLGMAIQLYDLAGAEDDRRFSPIAGA